MRKVRDIAMEEFRRQASNVKLSDVLAEKKKEDNNDEDEFEILQAPVRVVDELIDKVEMLPGCGYTTVYNKIKRGVVVVQESDE